MLKGFEIITHELTEFEETVLLPMLLAKLCNHKGKVNAISNSKLQVYVADRGVKQTVTGPRIRKIVEHIRQTNLLEGLVAGAAGYYIAQNPDELNEWIISMRQRIGAMRFSMSSALRAYKRMTGLKQPNQFTKGKIKVDPTAHNQSIFQ